MYMRIIYVQQKSTLNFLILVTLACIKVAKLFFFFFLMCVKMCTYKNVSRCAETSYFMPGVKFYCVVIKEGL